MLGSVVYRCMCSIFSIYSKASHLSHEMEINSKPSNFRFHFPETCSEFPENEISGKLSSSRIQFLGKLLLGLGESSTGNQVELEI